MNVRANSFRALVIDSGIVLVALSVFLTAAKLANSQEAATDLRPDPRTTDDSIDSRQNTDDNLASGNPTESAVDKGQTMVLGMTLFEDDRGRAMVTDVAATSPAWDAGIRPGDQIMELHGLKPTSFPKWSDDIGRLLRNTQDGQAVSVEVMRGNERISLRAKLPVSRAAEVRDARQEEQAIAGLGQGRQQLQGQAQGQERGAEYRGYDDQPPPYGPGYGGGGFGFFGDDGGGENTGGDANSAATNAVAELYAVNTLDGGGGQGGRAGMAAFRNGDHGVAAHVEVYGLPQGNYQVGISDGGSLTGGVGNGFGPGDGFGGGVDDRTDVRDGSQPHNRNQNIQRRNFNHQRIDQRDIRNRRDFQQRNFPPGNGIPYAPQNAPGTGGTTPGVGAPAGESLPTGGSGPSGGAGGATGGDSSSLARPDGAAYLAQVVDGPASGGANPNAGAGAGAARGANANPQSPNTTGAGQLLFDQAPGSRESSNRRPGTTLDDPPNATGGLGGAMPNIIAPIGMLQIGANGAGQVQGQIQGATVRHLAGLSVVVVPNTVHRPGTTGEVQNGAAHNANQAGGGLNERNAANRAGTNVASNQLGNNAGSGLGPVAMGTIHIVEGGGIPQQPPTDADELQRQQGEEVESRYREQQQRRDLTTPPEQTFDPSQPQSATQ